MVATDYFKDKVKNGEMTADEALYQVLDIFDTGAGFIDSLVEKYTEQKNLALKNTKQFEGNRKVEWYDATFNNTLLFLFDLEDIKCRFAMME